MNKLEETLQQIKEDISEIKHDLNYHIKRTDLLEKFMKDQIKFLLAVVVAMISILVGKTW